MLGQIKNTLVSGSVSDEKNVYLDGRKFFFLLIFHRDSLFIFRFFCFFLFLFFVVCCCLLHILIHIRLCGRVSDKKKFTQPVIRLLFLTLVYNNLANPGLLQRNPSSKLFWLTNLWVDKIQLPAHHKKAVKTNKNQSTIIKKFKLIFPGKSYFG